MTGPAPRFPDVHRTLERADPAKRALFSRLQAVYDGLDNLQDAHNRTPWKCRRSGQCCQVGLTLHYMECEWIALNLQREFDEGVKDKDAVVRSLERAFDDPDWTNGNIVGANWCSLFDGGCSAYPFRPAICRMFGVVLAADEWCPRLRLANGRDFVYVDPMTDSLVRDLYRAVDDYGRRFPERDYSVFYARGILEHLLPREAIAALRKRTPARFWKRQEGYRTQYRTSRDVAREVRRADASLLGEVTVRG